jgi:hypothetical protein
MSEKHFLKLCSISNRESAVNIVIIVQNIDNFDYFPGISSMIRNENKVSS